MPHDRHGLFMNVGFEGRKRQLSCLDWHVGHGGKGRGEMLRKRKAHVCYDGDKEAIVTMGVFQPVNWITFGKTCRACHTIHGGRTVTKVARMTAGSCLICHLP